MSDAPERIWTELDNHWSTCAVCKDGKQTIATDHAYQDSMEYIRADFYEHEVRVRKTFENFSKEKAQRIEQQAAEISRLRAIVAKVAAIEVEADGYTEQHIKSLVDEAHAEADR